MWLLSLVLVLPGRVQAQDYTYRTNNGTITITGYTGPGGDLAIPGAIGGMPVTSIGDYAFFGYTSLTNVTIPSSVTNIEYGAFCKCTGLTNVTIPNSVTNVGAFSFSACYSLANITIPNSVASIEHDAFFDCTGLTSVILPKSVTSIGVGTFSSCSGLTNITIPNSVTSIGSNAFYFCTRLASITIPGSVTSIEDSAFSNCTNLSGVYFRGNAPALGGPSVFENAYFATAYYLPGTTNWDTTFGSRPTKLWNPRIQTATFGARTNRVGFTIIGTTNIPVLIEACTNFSNPTWVPLQTISLTNGSCYFSDPRWTNSPDRFYRLRSP